MSRTESELAGLRESLDSLRAEVAALRELIEKKRKSKLSPAAAAADGPDAMEAWERLGSLTDIAHAGRDGVEFFFYTCDHRIGRTIHKSGNYTPEHLHQAVKLVEHHCGRARHRVFVDVGANIGTTSITAARQLGFERLLAVEPDPDNFKLLLLNRLVNGLHERMACINAALTDREGEVSLLLNPRNFGAHRIDAGSEGPGTAELRRRTVQGTTLAGLLRRQSIRDEDVGLVWMDTQGHEGHILRGAGDLLKHHPPLCMEFWPYGLQLASGFGPLVELLQAHYTHFINLRMKAGDASDGSPGRTEPVPIRQLEEFARTIPERRFTDILALRLK